LMLRSLPASTFLEYTADGSSVILGAGGQYPEVYDADTGRLQLRLEGGTARDFLDMTLSQDGRLLFMADESGVYMWHLEDVTERSPQAQRLALDFAVQQVAISRDGERLFVVGQDGMVHVMGVP